MRIKRLPLDNWMKHVDRLKYTLPYKRIPVVYGKPGVYKVGKDCWFEDLQGRAFEYEASTFDYRLEGYNVLELNHRHIAALRAIASVKLATEKQRRLLYRYRTAQETRDVYRRGCLFRNKALKHFRSKKSEKEKEVR